MKVIAMRNEDNPVFTLILKAHDVGKGGIDVFIHEAGKIVETRHYNRMTQAMEILRAEGFRSVKQWVEEE